MAKGGDGLLLRLYRPGNTSVHVAGITGATTLLSSREADSTLAEAREAHFSSWQQRGQVSFSSRPMGARHRYRFDHGLQGPGDLDADVRIRLKPYLVGHSILRHKVPAAQAGQDVEPQTWPSRVRRPRHRDEIWKGTTVATTISRELNSVFS